ncbi:hypothetical protein BDZ89DRAFT_1147061 [Hymenopellis radicata]|nr:hypothetical protein BDZ89DRAFT_1147061 [Hymenopellis radicata]
MSYVKEVSACGDDTIDSGIGIAELNARHHLSWEGCLLGGITHFSFLTELVQVYAYVPIKADPDIVGIHRDDMATTRSTNSNAKEKPPKRPSDVLTTNGPADNQSPHKKSRTSTGSDADTASSDGNVTNSQASAGILTADMQTNLATLRNGTYRSPPSTNLKTTVPKPTDASDSALDARPSQTQLAVGRSETGLGKADVSCSEDLAAPRRQSPEVSRPDNRDVSPADIPEDAHPKDEGSGSTKKQLMTSEFKPPKVTVLNRVSEVGMLYVKGSNREVYLPRCQLRDHVGNAPEFAERILNISAYSIGNNIVPIFSVEPRNFYNTVNSTGFKNHRIYAGSKGRKVPEATFVIAGRVMESNLLEPMHDELVLRQLVLQPIERMLPRVAAVTSRLTGIKTPIFEGEGRWNDFCHQAKAQTREGKREFRPYDEQVPVFDGTNPFKLVEYHLLPERDMELERGDFALVAYTISGWTSRSVHRVTCNIQFAVLLREYNANDKVCTEDQLKSRPDLFDETYLGVDPLTAMPAYDPSGKKAQVELPKGRILLDGPLM